MIRRFVILERRMVAELLAGRPVEVLACDLVDHELRAVAWAVHELRAWLRVPTDEEVIAIARELGVEVTPGECEQLRREGALREAA